MMRHGSVAFALAFILAGCGGGGGGGAVTAPPTASPTAAPTAPPNATVQVTVAVPTRFQSAARAPRYVSPATQTVRISVNGGAAQSFPVAGGSACSSGTQSASSTCVVATLQAPAATDTFTIQLLDGAGTVLSAGTTAQTIVAGQTNTLNVVFDGVVASLKVSLTNTVPPTGSNATIGVVLNALDAAG